MLLAFVHDQVETARRREEAAARVKPVVVPVKRGEKIIGGGERIEKRHLVVFEGMRAQRRGEVLAHVRIGAGALVALVVWLLWRVARRNLPRFRPARRDAILLAVLLVGTFALGFLGFAVADAQQDRFPALGPSALQYLIPFAAGAMIVRQMLAADAALLFAVAAGLAAGLLAAQSMSYAHYATFTSVAAAGLVSGQRDRAGLFRAGLGDRSRSFANSTCLPRRSVTSAPTGSRATTRCSRRSWSSNSISSRSDSWSTALFTR